MKGQLHLVSEDLAMVWCDYWDWDAMGHWLYVWSVVGRGHGEALDGSVDGPALISPQSQGKELE